MNINELAYNEKVQGSDRTAFLEKLIKLSEQRGINPHALMAIINSESAGTFSASIPNSSGCIGLIQFCDTNIPKYVNTTSRTDRVRQLDGVFAYLDAVKRSYSNAFRDVFTLYMSIFLPAYLPYIDQPDNAPIEAGDLNAYILARFNPGFDLNKDGYLQLGEFRRYINKFDPRALKPYSVGLFGGDRWIYWVIGTLFAVGLLWKFRKPIEKWLAKTFR